MDLVEKFIDLSIRHGSTLASLSKEPDNLECVIRIFQATVKCAYSPTGKEAEAFLQGPGSWLNVGVPELIEASKKLTSPIALKLNIGKLAEGIADKALEIKRERRNKALDREKEIALQRLDKTKDVEFMKIALSQAEEAEKRGEVPIGAVVVDPNGKVIGFGNNQNIGNIDPTAHAEIVAIRQAAKLINNHRLENCSIYVTLEPCPMCTGAIMMSRFSRLIYGASDPKAGAVDSVVKLAQNKQLNHHTVVTSGVLAEDSQKLLQDFFAKRRYKKE